MKSLPLNRREALALGTALFARSAAAQPAATPVKVFDVRDYGAVGDGKTLDSPAIQKAIDAAAAAGGGARVLVRGGKKYLVGTLELKSNIDFHLADDAELVASTKPEHYRNAALIAADGAQNLRISGTGNLEGRALEFLPKYDEKDEWYLPTDWRPKMFVLTGCRNLEVRDITFSHAPSWGLHMLGCEDVLVENLKVRNYLDVPNCDGIDPDHCRNVQIRRCHIVCGDDAVVVKSTRQPIDYGPCSNITVEDCVLETQDSGVKIGTETVADVSNVRFRNCEILSSCRGLTIQLRDEGNVHDIEFSDIRFVSRYHSDPWWGRGEAISFTAIPRNPQTKGGTIHDILVKNVSGRAENSVRINGMLGNPVRGVRLENVFVTLDRWTKYKGGLFDNRPTSVVADIEKRGNPGISIRHAENISLLNCRVAWGANRSDDFTHALEAEDVKGLSLTRFDGVAAHPERDSDMAIR